MGSRTDTDWILNSLSELLAVCSLDGIAFGEAKSQKRPIVYLERHSTGTLDLDNLYGGSKALIDCIRRARLVDGDNPGEIVWATRQVKVKHRKDQKTVIKIRYPR